MILISIALILLLTPVFGDSDLVGLFSSPYSTGFGGAGYGSNLVWPLGSRQTVAWNTSLSAYNVTLWQQSTTQNRARVAASPVFSLINAAGQNSKSWVVDTLDLNLDDSPVFLLWVNYAESATGVNGFTSPYFNVSRGAISTTSQAQSPTSAPSGNTPLTTSSTQSNSAQSAQNTPVTSDAFNTSGKIGLGIGLGLGIPLLILVGVLISIVARRSRTTWKQSHPPVTIPHYAFEQRPKYIPSYEIYEAPDASHMPGQSMNRAELDGTVPGASMARGQ